MNAIIHLARSSIQQLVPYKTHHERLQHSILLDANENPFWRKDGLNRYPAFQPTRLRQKLAALYSVQSSQLMMTRGSNEGIDLLIRVFCESHRDEIMITSPTYGMYEVAAHIQGACVIKVPLDRKARFTLHTDHILNRWHTAVKLIFLCSPHNPTGHVLNVDNVLTLCKKFHNKTLVVIDEAYIEFSTTESLSTYVAQYPNLVILRTLSKAFGLAGIRLGSLIADQRIIHLLMKVIPPYPIPSPVERVALRALSAMHQAMIRNQIQTIQLMREKLKCFLETLPTVEYVYPSQANFLLVQVKEVSTWIDACRKCRIMIRSQAHTPELHNCVRITIGTNEEIARLQEVLADV